MNKSKRKAAVIAVPVAIATATAAAAFLALPASAAPAASTTARVNDHIQLMTTSATSNTLSAIETGAFTGAGVDHSGNIVDTLVFPGGTYKAWHGTGTGTQTLNPHTCLLTVNLHGTDRAYGGTGKFRGISGHGTWQASVLAIYPRSAGKCSTASVPLAFQEVITGSGLTKF